MVTKTENKNSNERALIAFMLLIFAISIYCVVFDNSIFGLISLSNSKNNQTVVGHVSIYSKDVRRKDESSFAWEDAKRGDKVRMGDHIFTGKDSSVHVDLEKGGGVDLGENTMVSFAHSDGQDVANLTFGKMNVAVDGNMKVAINGKIQILKGNKSQIEITVDAKQKTQYRVLKGTAEVDSKAVEEASVPVVPLKTEEIVVVPKLTPKADSLSFNYTDQMYDFYELSGQRLLIRNERRIQIQHAVKLEWDTQGLVKNVEGQISSRESFDGITQSFSANSDGYVSRIVYLGDNFWHIKGVNLGWTSTQRFKVTSEPLQVNPPRLSASASEYYLLGDKIQLKTNIEADIQLIGFVVEYSKSPNFTPDQTQARFVDTRNISFSAREPQVVYLRARGINRATEITSYSQVLRISVLNAPLPAMPKLAEDSYKIFPEQTLDIEWAKAENSSAYQIELRNESNQIVETEKVTQNSHQYRIPKVGHYQVQVTAIDRFGRKSAGTSARVSVEPHILPQVVAKRIPPPPQARKLSSVSTISAPPPLEIKKNRNDKYSSSRIELEGGGESSLSSQALIDSPGQQPENVTLGLKVIHWLDHSGFQGFFGTKIAGLNSASSATSPLQLEARYLYRWSVPWNLFSNINHSQISLIGGYEFYQNSASGPYSPGYQLFKSGLGLQFPVAKSWDTGGEFLVGQGLDTSYEYEMSGNANYYLRSDWSVGLGYRLHLFQAGSAASAPSGGLPFREGYGEAFTVIRKHY